MVREAGVAEFIDFVVANRVPVNDWHEVRSVETGHITFNSKSPQWPTGIANSSGQLGKNLGDQLYGQAGPTASFNNL